MGKLKDFAKSLLAEELCDLQEAARRRDDNYQLLLEHLGELEQTLAQEAGWLRLTGESDKEFSREGLRKINQLARVYWIKNPLVKRAVVTQVQYVFGQGVNIQAHHPDINVIVQAFLDDRRNQAELTSHQSRIVKETELQVFGNLFFVFFANFSTGRVRVRTIPCDEIEDIICNPEDSKEPWFYKRTWQQPVDVTQLASRSRTAYYPDWRYKPPEAERLDSIGSHEILWNSPVYHVAVNKLSDMRFGISEVYAAIDWAKAYTQFLENWSTIVAAYARFAWQVKTPGGAAGVSAVKNKLQSGLGTGAADVNPAPATGSVFIGTPGTSMEPVRTAGATTSANDGRRLLLMICAATGIYEHFMGDPSTGNLATATSMERPMEMMFLDRQQLWTDVFSEILDYVVDWAVRAPKGALHAGSQIAEDEDGEEVIILPTDPKTELPLDKTIDVGFPAILQKDVEKRINSVVAAATLGGAAEAGTIPDKRYLARLLLQALGEDDVDALLDMLFPVDQEPEEPEESEPPVEAMMTEAVRELRGVVAKLAAGPASGA